MDICILQGQPIVADSPGECSRCQLYLVTCSPIVMNGWLTGAECDRDYCCDCPNYEICGR